MWIRKLINHSFSILRKQSHIKGLFFCVILIGRTVPLIVLEIMTEIQFIQYFSLFQIKVWLELHYQIHIVAHSFLALKVVF